MEARRSTKLIASPGPGRQRREQTALNGSRVGDEDSRRGDRQVREPSTPPAYPYRSRGDRKTRTDGLREGVSSGL
jgi:hypothetical protein